MALKFSNTNKGTLGDIQSDWSASEYATPVVPGDSSSSTNSTTYTGGYTDESLYLTDKSVTITHVPDLPEIPSLGSLTGKIQSNNVSGSTVAISQSSLATALNVDRTAKALTPGRIVGGVTLTPASAGFYNGGIYTAAASADGRYVFFESASNGTSGAPGMLTKYDLNERKVVFSVGRNQADPSGNTVKSAVVLANGNYLVYRGAGSGVYGNLLFYVYDGANGALVNTINLATPVLLPNTMLSISNTPDGNVFLYVTWTEFSSGTSYSRNRVVKFAPDGTILLDSGTRTIATTATANPTPATDASFIQAAQAVAQEDDTFIAYGAVMPGQTRYNAWGKYQLAAGAVTKIADLTNITDDGTYAPTSQDQYGNYAIGTTVYDSDGNLIFRYYDNVRTFSKRFDNGNGTSWAIPIGMNTEGNVTYMTGNYAYPKTENINFIGYNKVYLQSSVGFYQVDTSVSLSDVFSYYFGLVYGKVFSYPIDYQASSNPLVVLAGWNGNVWDHICQLCVVYGVELVFVNNTPTIRDTGSTSIDITEYAVSPQLNPSVVGNARTVTLSYQQAKAISNQATSAKTLTNLMVNPTARTNITGYQVSGVGTVSRSSGVVKSGQPSMRLTAGTKTNDPFMVYGSNPNAPLNTTGARMIGMSAGKSYTLRANVYKPAKTSTYSGYSYADSVGRIQVFAYDKNKKQLPVPGGITPVLPNAAGDYVTTVDFTVPAGTTDLMFQFIGSRNQETHWYNARLTQKGLEAPGYKSLTYYDGNSKGWTWTGTTNNSSSKLVIPGVPADNLAYDAYADENRTLTVDVLGRETTTIEISAYLTSFYQPTQTDSLTFQKGTYYVSASDGLPVTASQWAAYGGDVIVEQNKDSPSALDVTVVGPNRAIPGVVGPFSLSASDGQNNYAIFSIIGTGVKVSEKLLTVHTGVDEDKITREDAGQVDNFAINSIEQAWEMAYLLSDANSAATQELSLSVPIARIPGFGLTPGARFTFNGNVYRITQCTIGNAMASISATRHVLVDDVMSFYGDVLVDDLIATWNGYTAHDTVMRPLKPVG